MSVSGVTANNKALKVMIKVPHRLGIHGLISISQAASGGTIRFASGSVAPMRKKTAARSASDVMSERMTKNIAETTGDEPLMKPCNAESHVRRMSNDCQNLNEKF